MNRNMYHQQLLQREEKSVIVSLHPRHHRKTAKSRLKPLQSISLLKKLPTNNDDKEESDKEEQRQSSKKKNKLVAHQKPYFGEKKSFT